MRTARLDSANRLDIYNFDKQIQTTLDNIKKSVSDENYDLIIKYDRTLVSLSQSKASRLRNLKFLKALTLFNEGKNWSKLGKIAIVVVVISALIWKLYQRKKHSEDTK